MNGLQSALPSRSGEYFVNLESGKLNELLMAIEVQPPGWNNVDAYPKILLKHFGFSVKFDSVESADKVCFDTIELRPPNSFEILDLSQANPICGVRDYSHTIAEAYPPNIIRNESYFIPIPSSITGTYYLTTEPFWYPYDSLDIELQPFVGYHLIKNGTTIFTGTATPLIAVEGDVFNRDWDISIDTKVVTETVYRSNKFLVVHFERPLVYRLLYPALFVVLILLIALLASTDKASFLDGAVAIFLGIIGLRQLIMPPVTTRIYLDTALLGLYIVLAVPLGVHLYRYLSDTLQKNIQIENGIGKQAAKVTPKNDDKILLQSLLDGGATKNPQSKKM